jgi:hypothetical protein
MPPATILFRPTESSSPNSPRGIRKRVCKACDRCRIKKGKCDGANQCSRCKIDNAICVFGYVYKDLLNPNSVTEYYQRAKTITREELS